MSTQLPIIIVGAGVSGLAFAQGLASEGIPFKVFESDPSLDARTQGYRVRISDAGIEALEHNLSKEHFIKVLSCCNLNAGSSNIPRANLDAHTGGIGQPLFKPGTVTPITPNPLRKPLSVDRGMLRRVLVDGIEDRVFFGCRFQDYTGVGEHVLVRLEGGLEVQGSMLVGADGVWSRVRRQRQPDSTLLDTEARLLFGKTDMTEAFVREFSTTAAEGLTFIRDSEGQACLLEPMHFPQQDKHKPPADYVYWVLFLHRDFTRTPQDLLSFNSDECADLSKRLASSWHPTLRALFDHANSGSTSVLRILTTSPEMLASPDISIGSERVTLIGDAAHAMPPTAAVGANTALQDTLALLTSLKQHAMQPEALKEYERSMVSYATEALRNSFNGGKSVMGMKTFDELPRVSDSKAAQ